MHRNMHQPSGLMPQNPQPRSFRRRLTMRLPNGPMTFTSSPVASRGIVSRTGNRPSSRSTNKTQDAARLKRRKSNSGVCRRREPAYALLHYRLAGFDVHVAKPVEPGELVEVVSRVAPSHLKNLAPDLMRVM